MKRAGPVRLLSWNIHGGVGLDGCYDLRRVLALVHRHDPDIVSLQEVDSRGRAARDRPHQMFAEALGGNAAEAFTAQSPDGNYGHVLISRWPLANTRRHDISIDGREPRAAIETTVRSPYGDIHVVSLHLGLNILERRRQAEKLRAIAEEAEADVGLALGDFNDWAWPAPVQSTLSRVFPAWTTHRTWPARMPVFKLDRLYCRPKDALVQSYIDSAERFASDHLPLIVDIDPTVAGAR